MATKLEAQRQKIELERKRGILTRGRAIHYHCIDCVGFVSTDVRKCTDTSCPLWEFRNGNREAVPTNKGEDLKASPD